MPCAGGFAIRTARFGRKKIETNFGGKLKGCDFGYALAANSCERVTGVDACTVAALDAITAFAVPNLGGHLATPSIFSGLAVTRVASVNRSLSLL
jgi:hypothetical protein